MAKCDLSITFDDAQRTYLAGQVVTGQVHVDVNEPCKCKALKVRLQWRTHGRGNVAKGEEIEATLFEGEWLPGAANSYPFALTLPLAPATYHGHLINMDWYVTARADIPWAFDPKAEEDIIVVPGETGGDDAMVGAEGIGKVAGQSSIGQLVIVTIVMAILGGATGFGAWKEWGDTAGYFMGGCSTLCVLLYLWILAHTILSMIAERKLGPVEVTVTPARVPPGEILDVTLRFTPNERVHIEHITATFTCSEIAVSGSGTRQTTHRHEVQKEVVKLAENADLQAGHPFDQTLPLAIPAEGPLSLNVSSNRVTWTLEMVVDIKGLPAIKREREVWVWY